MLGSSLWQLAFRPFFLFGALHAALVMGVWIAHLMGVLSRPGYGDPIFWHAHEMIFGFTAAIIAGFVLTAAQNWTGIRGLHGTPLKILVGVWAAARLLMFLPSAPGAWVAVADLAFYPLLAYFMIPYLRDPELKVERVFFLFFALFFGANLLMHLQWLGVWEGYARSGIWLALDTVIVILVFMGGRVIPFFTESTIAKRQPRTWEGVELLSHSSVAAFLVLDAFWPGSRVFSIVALATAGVHIVRLMGWYVRRIRRIPLIWVLHVGYFWLVAGFALSGLSGFGILARSVAIHAFTVGGLGVIIYGMISRVSLGHTGRRLHPHALTVVGYYLLNLSALARVLGPLILPGEIVRAWEVSAVLWIASFVIFLFVYAPMLGSPRIDGRPG